MGLAGCLFRFGLSFTLQRGGPIICCWIRWAAFSAFLGVLNAGLLKSLNVPVPTLPLQKEFAQRVTEIRELEAGQSASRLRLDELFQSLLHRAFAGDL